VDKWTQERSNFWVAEIGGTIRKVTLTVVLHLPCYAAKQRSASPPPVYPVSSDTGFCLPCVHFWLDGQGVKDL
jgi:hypothetical protein